MLDLSLNTILLSGHHLTIRRVESVQSHFTKCIPGLRDFSYPHRRNVLSLDTLEPRRLHCDLTICYKIVFNIVKLEFTDFFPFIPVTAIRGHPYRLFVPFAKNSTRKNVFAPRVVKPWNYLPAHVVDFSTLNCYK